MGNHKLDDKILRKLDFLEIDCFNFPNNEEKLKEIEKTIDCYKTAIRKMSEKNKIDDHFHTLYYDLICRQLDILGKLSLPCLNCFDKLEDMYVFKYINDPDKGKRTFMDHYREINRPYSLLKNRCINLLYDLDEMYIKKFNQTPPNFNDKKLEYFER